MADDTLPRVLGAHRLSKRQRLVVLFGTSLTVFVLLLTVGYNFGMARYEGVDQDLFHSLRVVVETLTTTGFGSDADDWTTSVMELYVTFIQVAGIAIGFFTLRVLVIPLWKRTPTELDERLTPKNDHVVVCEYQRDSDVLLDELERLGVEYVLIDSDREEAKALSDAGYQVIGGDPEDEDTLRRASIESAALVVADAGRRNVSILLSARELNPDVRTVCLIDSAQQRRALEQIGIDRVVSPAAVVGGRLARLAARPVGRAAAGDADFAGDPGAAGVRLDDETVLTELIVHRTSPLRGRRLRDTALGAHPDIEVVGGWFDGRFRFPPDPDDRLTANAVVVVFGPEAAIDELRGEAAGAGPRRHHPRVVVAGLGEGGTAAVDALPDDTDVTTVDVADGPDVDVVGDVGEPETLAAAGLDEATALLVTVDDDATALLAIALARTMTDEIEVFARVTDADKVNNAYEAGADYVLSTQEVSARLLASDVYGERVLDPTSQIRTVRVDGDAFAGETVGEINAAHQDRFRLVGVRRDGAFLSDGEVTVGGDDVAVVVGADEAIQRFEREQV
ncbi:NAD-binding protein [Halomicrobium salinisoli]|uniref:NAD-binding protein n=1 Tax=Halomicrobium salinisoli TaxID=2878391 RepID=UPI001CF09552|nr:NAD-binding protein [Halomicrobium salinisoli]